MRPFAKLVVAAALIAALAFLSAPWFAFRAVKAAARDQDVQALAELVDYGAVRTGLRATLGPEPAAAPPPSLLSDPLGAMRRALEPLRPAPPAVDSYLTPAGLYALTRGERPGAAGAASASPQLRYWDPNRVRFAAQGRSGSTVVFTFQRRGPFIWKLVQILPPLPAARAP